MNGSTTAHVASVTPVSQRRPARRSLPSGQPGAGPGGLPAGSRATWRLQVRPPRHRSLGRIPTAAASISSCASETTSSTPRSPRQVGLRGKACARSSVSAHSRLTWLLEMPDMSGAFGPSHPRSGSPGRTRECVARPCRHGRPQARSQSPLRRTSRSVLFPIKARRLAISPVTGGPSQVATQPDPIGIADDRSSATSRAGIRSSYNSSEPSGGWDR
jgi:hypothetical protein